MHTNSLINSSLLMFGCNHSTTPLHIREHFSIPNNSISVLYNTLLSHKNILEVLILNTCNRVEIYIVADININKNDVINAYCKVQKISEEQCSPYWVIHKDELVIKHLFEVASGIDSQLIGETEILSQVKVAYKNAKTLGSTGKILNRIIQKSFQAAKWIHTNTAICKGQISIGSIACDLALRIFGDLSSTRILVIGSGEIGEKTALALKLRGADDLTVTNRTFKRACELAEKISATAILYENFPKMINQFDIVICSTGAPEVILSSEIAKKAMELRPKLPLFLIDLSLPRNICQTTTDIPNTFLYNIDDLAKMASENLKARQSEANTCRDHLSIKAQHVWLSIKNAQPNLPLPINNEPLTNESNIKNYVTPISKL